MDENLNNINTSVEDSENIENIANADNPFPIESRRLRWVDQFRGCGMLYLVATVAIDVPFRERSVAEFFLAHAGREATYMTLYDIGAAGFIFIIGLSMGISLRKRRKKFGLNQTLKHIGFRFLTLFAVGTVIIMADGGFIQERDDLVVVRWDVILGIATAYLLTCPFLFIKDVRVRLLIGIGWGLIYQVLLLTANLKAFAIASNHGGVFGSIFGYVSICTIASSVGEYLYFDSTDENKKYLNVLMIGIFFFVVCFLISLIPGMEASKRQVSFTYIGISAGVSILIMNIFVYLDRKKDLELSYLRAFGLNPFMVYFFAEITTLLIDLSVGLDLGITPAIIGNLLITGLIIVITSFFALRSYRKEKILSTEKMAIIGFVVLIILATILILAGVL